MNRSARTVKTAFKIAFLSVILMISQFAIHISSESITDNNATIVQEIIDTQSTKGVVDTVYEYNNVELSIDFHITSDTWNKIKDSNDSINVNFPDNIALDKTQNLELLNTDDNFENDTLHTLKSELLSFTDSGFRIDFTTLEDKPSDFRIRLNISISTDYDFSPEVLKQYPIMQTVKSILEENLNSVNSRVEETLPPLNEEEVDEVVNNVETTTPDANTIEVQGALELQLIGTPQANIKYNNALINDANPIDMQSYSETSKAYTIDLYSNEDTQTLSVGYVLKLDEQSLAKLTEINEETLLNYKNIKDNTQESLEYEYIFPNMIRFHDQTGDSILASSNLKNYSTSSLDRINPEENDGLFKLVVKETMIETSGEVIPNQFKFQEYITYKVNEYIHEEYSKGTSLEDIKETLKNGLTIVEDDYNLSGYKYIQKDRESITKLQAYPLKIDNILNSNKNIDIELPVKPIGGVNHTLGADSFTQIANGFELEWSGIANSTRKLDMNSLYLTFNEPTVVKSSGINNWDITTTLEVSFFDVLNDGTLVPSNDYSDIQYSEVNTITNKINPITLPLVEDNVAIKYQVKQTYTNSNLNIEVEGKQTARVTSFINGNQNAQASENSKEFPRSITIKGVKDAQDQPTTLLWNVVYNNNELVRQENDGFDFILDKDQIGVLTYNGTGSSYTSLNITYDILDIKADVRVDGKSILEDGRFALTWNEDNTIANIRLLPGIILEEEVKFQFKYYIDVSEEVTGQGYAIKDKFMDTSKIQFTGQANVKSFSNGSLIEPSTPTQEEKNDMKAVNHLILMDKKPIMIDYRTKEIIWGVSINTVTMERIGLPGLSFADKFGEGLEFVPMDATNPILMFKVNSQNTPQTSYGEYSKFIAGIKEIMADRDIYSDDIAQQIVGASGLLYQPINSEDETPKTFNEVIDYVNPSQIFYIEDASSTYSGQEYVVSYPQLYPEYVAQMPSNVQNGTNDPHVASPTKSEYLSDKDIRIDFVNSNKGINGAGSDYDSNAYYILYKTKIDSDQPLESVSNDASLLFANWIPGIGNNISWNGGTMGSSQDLGEVAKYNTVPKKDGSIKTIYDASTARYRLAVEWGITFNYDVDTRRVADVPMTITDTIDKTRALGNYNLGNKNLIAQNIDEIILNAYTVDKEGNLSSANITIKATKDSGELIINETEDKIEYILNKTLDPQYVYSFTINTLIVGEQAILPTSEEALSEIGISAEFENHVSYTQTPAGNNGEAPTPGEATKKVSFAQANRVKKSGVIANPSYSGSRQEILWTLVLNETYENMTDLVVEDVLEGKHTFKFVKNITDLEASQDGVAVLERFTVEEKINGVWRTVNKSSYTLTNLDNREDRPLDNWQLGTSGFKLNFNKAMTNPVRIQYATYGHVVDKNELPLINHANVKYDTDFGTTINHDVKADVNFNINGGAGGYEDTTYSIGLNLRYNDNQATQPTQLEEGNAITGNNVEKSILVLYRYQQSLVSNNHIYRIGQPDENGYVEFKNVEKGNYIVKQYYTADGYSVPNSLGFVEPNRVSAKDHSVEITNAQLASGNLVTINVEEPTNFFSLFGLEDENKLIEYAIYNTTPVFEINTLGKVNTTTQNITNEILSGINIDVTNSTTNTSEFTSSTDGKINVGTIAKGDKAIDFGTYTLSQPQQELNGYLHNSETIEHTIKSNPNGTVDATTVFTNFNNYKVKASLSIKDRNTQDVILNSSYKLERWTQDTWENYTPTLQSGIRDNEAIIVSDGKLDLYNLEVGRYRLTQLSVGSGYLLNTQPVEFYVYGPEFDEYTDSYEGNPETLSLNITNIKAKVNISNVIGSEVIDGSVFEIKDENNTVVHTFTILDSEAGYSLDLEPGNYTLVQTQTTQNRPIHLKPLAFNVETQEGVFEGEVESATKTVVFENHLGSFAFNTYSPNTNTYEVLDYVLQDSANSVETGNDNLKADTYTVSDVEIPASWINIETNATFTIPSSYTEVEKLEKVVDVYATLGKLHYNNYDGDNVNPLQSLNGKFTLLNNNELDSVVDGVNERFIDIAPGTYSFTQTNAPQGYGLNTEIIDDVVVPTHLSTSDVEIDLDTNSVGYYSLEDIDFYNYRGKVQLTKESFETKEKLENVAFDLYYEGQKIGDTYYTNKDGKIELDQLEPGNYYFEEIQGDGNHVVGANKTPFTIADENIGAYPVHELEVLNYYANVQFKNTNPSGEVIYKDGKFSLYEMQEDKWKVVDGFINFTIHENKEYFEIFGIKAGRYKLVQTAAPSNTVRNTYEYTFEIPEYTLEEIEGRVLLTLDDYINYQANVAIDLVDPNGSYDKDVVAHMIGTSLNPELIQISDTLTSSNIGTGVYKVYITKATDAIVYDEVIDITIPESALNDEGLSIRKEAKVTYAKASILLQDGKGMTPLNSGSYEINENMFEVGADGVITLDNLSPNVYSYKQLKAADTYLLNTLNKGQFEIFDTISKFDTDVVNMEGFPVVELEVVEHQNYQVDVNIHKVNELNESLSGVVFSLGDTLEVTTDQEGKARLEGLAPGTYSLKEVKTIDGYELLKETIQIDVIEEAEGKPDDINITVTNKKIKIEKEKPNKPEIETPNTEKPTTLPNTGVGLESLYTSALLIILGMVIITLSSKGKKSK